MKLSVVIPTYNRCGRLRKSLETYLAESIEDVEFIIVDNNSSDDTEVFIKESQEKDHRIKYFKNPQNIGYNRNIFRGFLESKADWITILADDDCMEFGYLSELINIIESNNTCAIIMNALKHPKGDGEYKVVKSFNSTQTVAKGKDAIKCLFMSTGSVPGFTFNKNSISQDDWNLDRSIYPQIKIGVNASIKHDVIFFVPNNFIVMSGTDSIMTIATDAMNRPLDYGICERLDILVDVARKLPECERSDVVNELSFNLFVFASDVFVTMYKEDKIYSIKYLKELTKNKFIKSSLLFIVAFSKKIFANRNISIGTKLNIFTLFCFCIISSIFTSNFYSSTYFVIKKIKNFDKNNSN